MNSSKELVKSLSELFNQIPTSKERQVVVFPSYPYLSLARELFKDDISIGAQNIYFEPKGAFTGEVSAQMVLDVGAKWTIVGHSERRTLLNEDNACVAKKALAALSSGLKTIFCVGENLDQRKGGKQHDVIEAQLNELEKSLKDQKLWKNLVIAYEPLWAIGTGEIATPDQVQCMHAHIKKWLSNKTSQEIANEILVIYGGSVNAANCNSLSSIETVNGFLVGGASLKQEFIDICKAKHPE